MNANKKIHDANLLEWAALIKEQSESGLTIADWCSQKGISKDKYFYWKRLVKEACLDSVMPEIVPLNAGPIDSQSSIPMLPEPTPPSNFDNLPNSHNLLNSRESRDLYNSCHSADTISVFMGDIRIEIGSNASDELIAKVIGVMRRA